MKLFRQPFGSALVLAALVLRPCPAIGQHGGGGHGGGRGGHFGGGGGGHFAGFGGSHSHSSAHQSTSHASGKPVVKSAPLVTAKPSVRPTPLTGEFAPFSPGPEHTTIGFPASEQPTTFPALSLHSAQSAGPLSFSGEGHQIWQNFATPSVPAFHPHPAPPHIVRPPVFFAPPAGFVPTFGFWGLNPFGGFGWGCGPLYVGAYGCGGFGYGGYGPGYGYGFGGYYSPAWDYSQAPSSDDTSNEPSPSTWQNPPTGGDLEGNAAVSIPNTVIYLQDGSSYEVTDYWFSDNKLHYVTNYGGENSVALSQIDWQRTVDANAARGVDFTLHPAPPPALTPPPSVDSAPPATPQP